MLRASLLVALLAGCSAAAQLPRVNVVGVTSQRLLVEIHNPTDYPIELDAFDWTLLANGRKAASGTLALHRVALLPGGSTVVELPVAVRPAGDYRLDGRLRADDRATWRVSTRGRFQ
jgi:hypothetical protein